MGFDFVFPYEIEIMEFLQKIPEFLISIISALSFFGEQYLTIAVITYLYLCRDKQYARYVSLNIFIANVWNPLIKNIFLRRRPYFDHAAIKIFRPLDSSADIYDTSAQGFSFPSGHSTNAVTLFGSLAMRQKEGRLKKFFIVCTVVLPLLVAFSRVVVGAHYPTDVFFGLLLGVFIFLFIPWLQKKIKNQFVFYLVILLISATGLFYCQSDDYFTCFGMLVGYVFSVPFESKYVKFENPKHIVSAIIRIIGAIVIFLILNVGLKLPFDAAFLASGSFPAHLVRTVRYAIIIFTLMGVYPLVFKYTDNLFIKKEVK